MTEREELKEAQELNRKLLVQITDLLLENSALKAEINRLKQEVAIDD